MSQTGHMVRTGRPLRELYGLAAQFFRFGMAGAAGFAVDTGIVYASRHALGLYGAAMLSYVVAATTTWSINRAWAFRGRGAGPAHHQWVRFLAANLVGFVLNRGTYSILVTVFPLCAAQPVIALFAGTLAGMFVNFGLARQWVFR